MRGCCTQRALRCAGGEAGGDSAGRGMSRSGRGGPVTWAAPPPRAAAGPRWAGPRGVGPSGGGAGSPARRRQRHRRAAGVWPGPRSPGGGWLAADGAMRPLRGLRASGRGTMAARLLCGSHRSPPGAAPLARALSATLKGLPPVHGSWPGAVRLPAHAPRAGTGGIVSLPCATPPCPRSKRICAAAATAPGCAGKGPGHKGAWHKDCSFCGLGRAAQTVGRDTQRRAEGALKDGKITYRKTRKDNSPDSVLLFDTELERASGTGQQTEHFISSPSKWTRGFSVLCDSVP